MNTALGAGLVSGSIDASLEEIEVRLNDPEHTSQDEVRVGPFAVLNISLGSCKLHSTQTESTVEAQNVPDNTNFPTSDMLPGVSSFSSVVDPLSSLDDTLHFSDLFGFNSDLLGIMFENLPETADCLYPECFPLLPISETSASNPALVQDGTVTFTGQADCTQQTDMDATISRQDTQNTPVLQLESSLDLLADAPFLLKNFRENVIPLMTLIPLGKKTPWEIVSLPAAMLTLGELTIFKSEDISHARRAHFHVLLALSAMHLTLNTSREAVASTEHWMQIAGENHRQAKVHMQMSLREEISGLKKAKDKDQFMASCAMAEFAIFSGLFVDARCHLLDAERLLRLRGLAKPRTSRKMRLLLNVYTWLRIMGESTYVLHDYRPSDSLIEALNSHYRPGGPRTVNNSYNLNQEDHRLDDFLHFTPWDSDSDLDIDEPKDREMDIPDIHLQDSRKSSESLYKQVYGIPETWLSLVSQTTRLANVMETIRVAPITDWQNCQKIRNALHQRSVRLENVINSFNLKSLQASEPNRPEGPRELYGLMLQALCAALVVFFYRRIRNVHPAILKDQVDTVVTTLLAFDAALSPSDSKGSGTLWPLFVAGCEAITDRQRIAVLKLLEKGEIRQGIAPFTTAKDIMTELWRKQDVHLATNQGESVPTWIDVVRERQIWPTFC
ncbi:uncharacterized protein N7496_007506 [Penicillium cataractarum]|uniref:Arginine metabolism regulation protein II n=1 Tax=Penicillium cataractarum TaxID=2100454 RepID=A0A9W9S5M3_9EURO|nr:uncharacterized protein N7496_007506 [Penicillium cataractarum]KAJ5371414.1 hypothetical protein N7496_007506 [Penicillium cataractarum]